MKVPNKSPNPQLLSAQGIAWAPVAYLDCSNSQGISLKCSPVSFCTLTPFTTPFGKEFQYLSLLYVQNHFLLFVLNQG